MAEIKQAKFIDQTGQEKDAVFVGAEKAIYDDSGKRLDQKLEEREKATGLLASDTQGILGNIGAEVSLQSIIDKVAEKIMRELVSNSSLTQTLANYMTTAMMSGEQIDDGNKVPTSALAFAMNQAITQNKNAITQLNSDWQSGRTAFVAANVGRQSVSVNFQKEFSAPPRVFACWNDNENIFDYCSFLSVKNVSKSGFVVCTERKKDTANWWFFWLAIATKE